MFSRVTAAKWNPMILKNKRQMFSPNSTSNQNRRWTLGHGSLVALVLFACPAPLAAEQLIGVSFDGSYHWIDTEALDTTTIGDS